jgi:hypothetical protein
MSNAFEIWSVYFQDATLAIVILSFLGWMLRYVFKVKRFRLRRHGSEFNLQFTNSDNSHHSDTVELSPISSDQGEESTHIATDTNIVLEALRTIERERRASQASSTHSHPENTNLPTETEAVGSLPSTLPV